MRSMVATILSIRTGLAACWAAALGGPPRFTEEDGGEPSVVRMHSGNGLPEDMNCRANACFDQALVDVGLATDARLRQVWTTTSRGLRPPRWPAIIIPPATCPQGSAFRTGLGTASSTTARESVSDWRYGLLPAASVNKGFLSANKKSPPAAAVTQPVVKRRRGHNRIRRLGHCRGYILY